MPASVRVWVHMYVQTCACTYCIQVPVAVQILTILIFTVTRKHFLPKMHHKDHTPATRSSGTGTCGNTAVYQSALERNTPSALMLKIIMQQT